jgi:xylan 1,4-beta-xylosidase
VGRFPSSFSRPAPDGGIIINADTGTGHALLAARATDLVWTASTRLAVGDTGEGRFSVRIDDRHRYGLTYDGSTVEATLTIGPIEHSVGRWEVPADTTPTLRISAKSPRPLPHGISLEPDLIELAVAAGADEHTFGAFDGRYLSTEVTGGFTGRVFGVEAITGQIHVHEITYTPETGMDHND